MNTIHLKNILIHLLLIPFYFLAKKEIGLMPEDKWDTLLLFVGLIVIAPITSNFIYSYKNSVDKKSILFGSITTFFSMIVVGMLFIILDILLVLMVGNVFVFRISLILFWVAVITFDYADYLTKDKNTA